MKSDNDGKRIWFAVSFLSGLCWGLAENVYKRTTADLVFLKNNLKHPISMSPENEGKIVYIAGNLRPSDPSLIKDELFTISLPALKLKRTVEMFQFQKEGENYQDKWFDKPIISKEFAKGFENPDWKIPNLEISHKGDLMVNEYKIPNSAVNSICSKRNVIGRQRWGNLKEVEREGKLILFKKKKSLYRPRVGDYRISHEYIPSGIFVSLIGLQKSREVVPYRGIFIIREDMVEAEQLIEGYKQTQSAFLWFFRVLCSFGVGLGLYKGSN